MAVGLFDDKLYDRQASIDKFAGVSNFFSTAGFNHAENKGQSLISQTWIVVIRF